MKFVCMIAAENAGKLTCKWLRNMNHKIQETRKNALMHETTRVSIRVKPKNCAAPRRGKIVPVFAETGPY
jgi:hypothetical protein